MKFLKPLLVSAAASLIAVADAATIKGRIVDPESHAPIEFANIVVKGANNRIYGGVSDSDGRFSIHGVPNGSYTVTASFVGYLSSEMPVSVGSATVNIGTIELNENENVLQEVEVKAIKSQMRFELDRKVFDVEADLAAAGTSASELLENIPSVEVDNDGEVSLRGNSSVTIWINGKDSGLTSDNRAEILEQLPAESIERVEIITNPSAKYSPEGTAGIINIVLKRGTMMGYYGGARASANTWGGYNANGSINMNFGKWDTNFSAGYRYGKNDRNSQNNRTYDDGSFLNSEQTRENTHHSVFLRAGASYYHNERNEIYFNGFGMFGKSKNKGATAYDSNRPGENLSEQGSRSSGNNQGGNFTVGYKHTFSDKHTIDLSSTINGWRGPRDNWMNNIYEYDDNTPSRTEEEWQLQRNESKSRNIEFQADYTLPIAGKYKFEAGYKGNINHQDSPVSTFSGPAKDNVTLDEDLYNRFIYDQNIQAAYATIGGTVGKFSFQGGIRGEYWQISAKSLAYGESEATASPFRKNHFQLFPSAFLSYSLPRQNEMQINYTRRIRRPWGGQLNSFRNTSDPTNISYGNPYLNPEYSNAFELNYIKTWERHMASVSAYYRSTDNVIQRINFINDLTGVMNTTFENVSQSVATGTEIVIKNNLFNIVDLTTTANLYYYKLDGFEYTPKNSSQTVTGKGNSDFSWDIRAMARIMLPLDFSVQLNGGYNAPRVIAQGTREGSYRFDAGIRKSFDKWSLSLNVRDILDSRSRESLTYGNGYTQHSKSWGSGRRFQLTLSYSFGNMKPKKERNFGNNMNEDDSEQMSDY